mgnify:CR=1 FL=1
MNAIRLFAALLVLGLGGCANYPMGSLKTDLLPAEDVAASYSLNTAWWKGYHDADLDRIVALALERNVDLALSAIKVNRALYQARLLSADLVPSFSANASAAASHNIDNGNAARSYQTEFGVSYEVDLWQKLRNAANAQEWEYKATMEDREAARLALVNSVADTYFELKYLDESFKVMVKELQALALDIRVLNQNGEEVNLSALCNEDDQPAYRRRAPRTERDPDEEDIERATGQFVETGDLSDSYLVEKNEMNPEEEYSDETDYGAAEQDGDDLSDGYDE